MATRFINIFCSYSECDKSFKDELFRCLNKTHIAEWHEREVETYIVGENQLDPYLKISHIILLLISVDFLSSDYCYDVEIEQALEMHEANKAVIIPVMIRPVIWEPVFFSKIPMLPTNGRPITSWQDTEQAFREVSYGIGRIINRFLLKQYLIDAEQEMSNKSFDTALSIYQQALLLAPDQAKIWRSKGKTLTYLSRFEEALDAYEQAIRLEPSNPYLYKEQGDIFYHLMYWHEALASYNIATRLKPDFSSVFLSKIRINTILVQREDEKINQIIEQSYKNKKISEKFLKEE